VEVARVASERGPDRRAGHRPEPDDGQQLELIAAAGSDEDR
jgi:hypothetical protein